MPHESTRPGQPLELRAASENDFASIIRLVSDPTELFLAFPAAHWPLDFRQLKRLAEERLDLTVGRIGTQTVAFANLYGLEAGQWAFIGNVVVHRDYRGMGLGRALLNHMLSLLTDKHQLNEARISVFSDNRAAQQLYRSMDFEGYDEESRTAPDGNAVILLHMRRPLPLGETTEG